MTNSPGFTFPPQLIQTVSAVDQDNPRNGQHFYYSLAPEAANNPNFTVRDNQGNPLAAGASPQRGLGTVGCYTTRTVSEVTGSVMSVAWKACSSV